MMERKVDAPTTATLCGIPEHRLTKLRDLKCITQDENKMYDATQIAEIIPTGGFPENVKGLIVHMGVDEGYAGVPSMYFDESKDPYNAECLAAAVRYAEVNHQVYPEGTRWTGHWNLAQARHTALMVGGRALVSSHAGLVLEGGWVLGSAKILDGNGVALYPGRMYAVLPFSPNESKKYLRKLIDPKRGSVTQDL